MTDVTHVNQDNQDPRDDHDQPTTEGSHAAAGGAGAGLPLRGLAMVLIAVAVLLGLWGLYAMTRDDSGDTAADAPAEETTVAATEAATPTAGSTEEPADLERAEESEGAEQSDEAERPSESAGAPAPAPAPAGGAEEPARLHVLNNSTVPNLANDVATTLDDQGYDVGEVGNLADQILPENTVYFQPGNPDAEQRARELADRVRGVAREYDPVLPAETDGRNDITLVLVNQVAL